MVRSALACRPASITMRSAAHATGRETAASVEARVSPPPCGADRPDKASSVNLHLAVILAYAGLLMAVGLWYGRRVAGPRRLLRRGPPPRARAALRHPARGQHRGRLDDGGGRPRLPRRPQRVVVGGVGGHRLALPRVLGRPPPAAPRRGPRPADRRRLPRAPLRPGGARPHRGPSLGGHPRHPRGSDHRDGRGAPRGERARARGSARWSGGPRSPSTSRPGDC